MFSHIFIVDMGGHASIPFCCVECVSCAHSLFHRIAAFFDGPPKKPKKKDDDDFSLDIDPKHGPFAIVSFHSILKQLLFFVRRVHFGFNTVPHSMTAANSY